VGLIVVMVLAAACQHADRSVGRAEVLHQIRINGVPVIEERSFPPGTPLGNGFVVPKGTRLLGAVVPRRFYNGTNGRGWWAILALTGSIPMAVEDFSAQLRAQNMPVSVHCSEAAFCGVSGENDEGGAAIDIDRGPGASTLSSLMMTYQTHGNVGVVPSTSALADSPSPDIPDLPRAGDEALPAYRPFHNRQGVLHTALPPGAVVVGPLARIGNLETGVVVSTRRPPEPVVASFVKQFKNTFDFEVDELPVETHRVGRTTVRHYSVGDTSLVELDIYLVDPPTGPNTIILDRLED
jgi:hypothetical protein